MINITIDEKSGIVKMEGTVRDGGVYAVLTNVPFRILLIDLLNNVQAKNVELTVIQSSGETTTHKW